MYKFLVVRSKFSFYKLDSWIVVLLFLMGPVRSFGVPNLILTSFTPVLHRSCCFKTPANAHTIVISCSRRWRVLCRSYYFCCITLPVLLLDSVYCSIHRSWIDYIWNERLLFDPFEVFFERQECAIYKASPVLKGFVSISYLRCDVVFDGARKCSAADLISQKSRCSD